MNEEKNDAIIEETSIKVKQLEEELLNKKIYPKLD